jgi:hypothetical protein
VTPEGGGSAKVFFKTDEDQGWYAVRLRSDDERYAAILPRPRDAKSFRYYVEATGDDMTKARTPEYVATVVDRPQACAGKRTDSVAVAASIIVEPPAAASRRDKPSPVPTGFSTRGTAGDVGQFELGTAAVIGASVLLGGAAVAGAVAASHKQASPPPPVTVAPRPDLGGDIRLLSSTPPPGGQISLSATTVSMAFMAVAPYAITPGPIRVDFSRSSTGVFSCGTLSGSQPGLRPNEPITVTVSGHLNPQPGCPDQFPVRLLRVQLYQASGPAVLQTGSGFIPDLIVDYEVVP